MGSSRKKTRPTCCCCVEDVSASRVAVYSPLPSTGVRKQHATTRLPLPRLDGTHRARNQDERAIELPTGAAFGLHVLLGGVDRRLSAGDRADPSGEQAVER